MPFLLDSPPVGRKAIRHRTLADAVSEYEAAFSTAATKVRRRNLAPGEAPRWEVLIVSSTGDETWIGDVVQVADRPTGGATRIALLRNWIESHGCRPLWRFKLPREKSYVEGWSYRGAAFVVVVDEHDGWDIYTALNSINMVASLADAESRLQIADAAPVKP